MNLTNRTLSIFTAASLLISGSAFSAESTLKEKVQAAMTNDIRQTSDTERDENRKPLETLSFFGLEPDMRIVELIPGCLLYTSPSPRDS